MSKQNLFGEAAAGSIPITASITELHMGGKEMDINETTVSSFTHGLSKSINDGVMNVINMVAEASKNILTKAFPSAGLKANGDETVPYKYKGGGNFGFPEDGAIPAAKP